MRVLVTGGRTFTDRKWLFAALDRLHALSPITEIIEGGAAGADFIASAWAGRHQVACTTVEADWDRYGKSAGAIRNRQMAELRPDIVLAAPGGAGTQNMRDTAKAMNLKVILLEKMDVPKSQPREPEELVIEG